VSAIKEHENCETYKITKKASEKYVFVPLAFSLLPRAVSFALPSAKTACNPVLPVFTSTDIKE
jgi:hypothetical protein